MELNSIINDSDITNKMQDIYKYIDKNKSKIDNILDRTFNDLVSMYENVTRTTDGIDVVIADGSRMNAEQYHCQTVLNYHGTEILNDNKNVIRYAFKVNIVGNMITISKKH